MKIPSRVRNWFGLVRSLDNQTTNITIGEYSPLRDEPIRLASSSKLAFPAKDIESITLQPNTGTSGGNSVVSVTHSRWGLTGSVGALPYVYSELSNVNTRFQKSALKDFFNIFNHRSLSLLYKAWKKYRFHIQKEKYENDTRTESDSYTSLLSAISGLADTEQINSTGLSANTLLSYTGLLARQVRSAQGLSSLLSQHFLMNIQVEELVARWVDLDKEVRSQIRGTSPQANNQLGSTCILGSKTWLAQPFFRVLVISPTEQEFASLTPSGSLLQSLQLLTQLYAGVEFAFDIEIRIPATVLPRSQLNGKSQLKPILGWNTLIGQPCNHQTLKIRIARNYYQPKRSATW